MSTRSSPHPVLLPLIIGVALVLRPIYGFTWGEHGHRITGLIAERYLTATARQKVAAMLASDSSGLVASTRIADEALWADKYRDSDRDTDKLRYRQTQAWHYIDLELDRPDIAAACSGHPRLAPQIPASQGPAEDCILDKIAQFRRELSSSVTAPRERLLALQYLLHFIGDLHQPLHASDRHDKGGNDVIVRIEGRRSGTLHHYWDTVFVEELGPAEAVAAKLLDGLSAGQRRALCRGSPTDWAWQSFEIGKAQVYGRLPAPATSGSDGGREILLDDAYVARAAAVVTLQLQRAGLRLARVLNESLRD